MSRFFVDTGDGVHYVETEDKAKKLAAKCLAEFRECARIEGEWRDEVESVCWGAMVEYVTAVAVGDSGDYTDYQLRPDWEAISAETAQATRERHEEAMLTELTKSRARVSELEAFLIAVAKICRHLAKSRQGAELGRMVARWKCE